MSPRFGTFIAAGMTCGSTITGSSTAPSHRPAAFSSDPLLLALAAAGFSALLRRDRVALSRPAAGAIAAALAVPPVLMLMAFVMAFRYRMEVYPLFVFLALIGRFGANPKIA